MNVSALAHTFVKYLDVGDLNFKKEGSNAPFFYIYSTSKLCNILFTTELARRLKSSGAVLLLCNRICWTSQFTCHIIRKRSHGECSASWYHYYRVRALCFASNEVYELRSNGVLPKGDETLVQILYLAFE